jgi:hypothetical protein
MTNKELKKVRFEARESRAKISLKITAFAAQLSEAEQRAGIAERDGWRRGVADQHSLRRAYFAVPDLELRKTLIGTVTEIHSLEARRCGAECHCDGIDLAIAKKPDEYAHILAAFDAGGLAAAGGIFFGVVGAIVGAAAGYFIGLGVLEGRRRRRLGKIAAAQAAYKSTKKLYESMSTWMPWFTKEEVHTGVSAEKPVTPEEIRTFFDSLTPAPLG